MRKLLRSLLVAIFAIVILMVLTGVGYVAVATAGHVPDWVPITALIVIGLIVAFGMWHKLAERTS